MFRCFLLLALSLAVVAGCKRDDALPAPVDEAATPAAQADAPLAPVELKDVIETRPDYIVGISYPDVASKYPQLARALHDYAERARGELMQSVAALNGQKPAAPYDLSLQFRSLAETPRIVSVAADGSSYTGGAHGNPLVERFVWLPQQQKLLTADQLIADAAGWKTVSDVVREQLMTELSQQLDDEGLEADARSQALRNGSRMIDAGTAPEAANFARFEPVMNADGSIRVLRFVFPPYQVAPYAEGTRTVDVPAQLLLPLVAPEYKALFRAG
ncbi:MAG: DUF4163 domain-containing protein [Thermomonas sp.]|uniref:DUF3298 and DUF4163 domain-containing protein n=1 Tax=Thermomonas sp. TaxID=1971895 RepID=UPI0039E3FBB1